MTPHMIRTRMQVIHGLIMFSTNKLKNELSLNRIKGPYKSPTFNNIKVSPFGVVPKKSLIRFLPASSMMVSHLIAYLYIHNFASSTISGHLSAISFFLIN